MDTPTPSGRLLRRGVAVARHEIGLHPKPFFTAVLGSSVYAGATVASSYVLGRVVDTVVIPRFEEGRVPTATVALACSAVVLVGLVKAAGIVLRRFMATTTVARVEASLRTSVVEQYQRLPFAYHRSHPTGQLLSHASADPEAAADMLSPLPFATGVIVMVVIAVGWLVVTDPFLAAVGLLTLPGLVLLNGAYQRRMEAPATVVQERLGDVSAVAHESFDGALVVKALGREEAEARRFGESAEELRRAKVVVATRRATFDAVLDTLPALANVAIVVVGAWRIEQGAISVGTLISFVALYALLTYPLRVIFYVLADVPRAVAGFDRVAAVLAEPQPPPQDGTHRLPPGGPLDLAVEGLTFAYEPGGPPTVADLTFGVRAGETVAVVGPTGAGKSTLVLLLTGLLRPGHGAVRLGGVDVADLRPGELTGAVGVAFQEAFLFADTVAENVLLGAEDRREIVDDALRLAEAERFVAALPAGVETRVGERGATLSGGQRQRLALARALVRRPRLLLLDDATSAVDPTTEARILGRLADHLEGTTTLVVAHRPSTLALADRVLYLEGGRLAGMGTHEHLLETSPGYERLVRAYEQERVA